jgi:hypothetical protein
MSYEVPTGPIRRSRRPILVPPLIAVAVVVSALLAGPGPASFRAPAASSPAPATAAPLDSALTSCRELRPVVCRETIRAAQLVLEPGFAPIASATAWRSLVCGDDSDCPRGMLDGARPAGSVVFTFVDGSSAAVNVLWVDVSSRRFEDGTELLRAYVVRWFAAGA